MTPEFSFKLRRIFLPYVLFVIGAILIYSLFNLWVQDDPFPIFKERTIDIYLPFGFAVLAPIFMLPRYKLLNLNPHNDPKREPYAPIFLVSIITVGLSIVTMQGLLRDSAGNFTHLKTIEDIQTKPKTRFYTAEHYYVQKKHPLTKLKTYISGKHDETLNFDYYFLLPIYNTVSDTTEQCDAWLGWIYSEKTHNRRDELKDSLEKDFLQHAMAAYEQKKFQNSPYLTRIGNTDERDVFQNLLSHGTSKIETFILVMPDEPFDQKRNVGILKFLTAFCITIAVGAGIIFLNDLNEDVLNDLKDETSLPSSPE